MAQTELEARLRDELQIISMVLYLANPEFSTDPSRIKTFVQDGQSALDRVVDILDRSALHSAVPNNAANIVVMKPAS
jgi:hypothetical protein